MYELMNTNVFALGSAGRPNAAAAASPSGASLAAPSFPPPQRHDAFGLGGGSSSGFPFAPALARQSTGMLEATELREMAVADRYRGEASEAATARAEQLRLLQRAAAGEQRRAEQVAAHTSWRPYPSTPFYGSMAGLRLSVLTATDAALESASGGGTAGRTDSPPPPSSASSSSAPNRTTKKSTAGGGGGSDGQWELATVPNSAHLIEGIAGLCRTTGGSRLMGYGGGSFAGSASSSCSEADKSRREMARFYRRHCCYYQFGPDLATTALEAGHGHGGAAGGGGGGAALDGASALAGPQGAGVRSGGASATTVSAALSSSAASFFNIIDGQSYLRYVEAFVSAFEAFGALHTEHYANREAMLRRRQTDAGREVDDEDTNIIPALDEVAEACFENLSLQSVHHEKPLDSDSPSISSSSAPIINDHTMTIVCTAHPKHKSFSLHLFFESLPSPSSGSEVSESKDCEAPPPPPPPRMSAMLVADSAAFQREVSAQLSRVMALSEGANGNSGHTAAGAEAPDVAEWFGGALFVQEATPTTDRSSGSRSICPVAALVDIVLNVSLLCEEVVPSEPSPASSGAVGGRGAVGRGGGGGGFIGRSVTTAGAVPVEGEGADGSGSGSRKVPTRLVHKGSLSIVASFPFSGAQQREVLIRALEPQAATIPFVRTYASLLREAAEEEEDGEGGDGAAAARLAPVAPVPLPATRHSFLIGLPVASIGGGARRAGAAAGGAGGRSALTAGAAVITPRALRAVLALLVDRSGLASFELGGLMAATARGEAQQQTAAPTSESAKGGEVATAVGAAGAPSTATAKGLALLSASTSGGAKGGGGGLTGHHALSSLDAGAGGNAIVSVRLFPTRLCGEAWVTVAEQRAQGIEPDDSDCPCECMFYPASIAFRRSPYAGGATQQPNKEGGLAHRRIAGAKSSRTADISPSPLPFFGNFRIDNAVLWFLDDEDEEEEGEEYF